MEKLIVAGTLLIAVLIGMVVFTGMKNSDTPSSDPLTLSSLSSGASKTVTPSIVARPTSTELITPTPQIDPIGPVASDEGKLEATQAAIMTNKGEIVIDFYGSDAPNTIANFVKKAKSGFYKNLTFHRVEDWVVQGGDPKGDGTGGGSMPVEFNKKPFVVGSVGVASRGDGKIQNDSQFFITKTDASWLNEKYTNFGMVSGGIDVVQKMEIGDKILDITLR